MGLTEERRFSEWVSFQHCNRNLPKVSSLCSGGTSSSLQLIPTTCVQCTQNIFVLGVECESKPITLGKTQHLPSVDYFLYFCCYFRDRTEGNTGFSVSMKLKRIAGSPNAGNQVYYTTFTSCIEYKKMKNIWDVLLSRFLFYTLFLLWIYFQNQTFWVLLGGYMWVWKHHSMWDPVKDKFHLFSLASVCHDLFNMTIWETVNFSKSWTSLD